MALGDMMETRSSMVAVVSNHLDRCSISNSNSLRSSLNQTVAVVSDGVVDGSSDMDSSTDSVAGVQRRGENSSNRDVEDSETVVSSTSYYGNGNVVVNGIPATSMAYLPQNVVLCEIRHDAFEACTPSGPAESGLVSKWRPKDRVNFCFCCI